MFIKELNIHQNFTEIPDLVCLIDPHNCVYEILLVQEEKLIHYPLKKSNTKNSLFSICINFPKEVIHSFYIKTSKAYLLVASEVDNYDLAWIKSEYPRLQIRKNLISNGIIPINFDSILDEIGVDLNKRLLIKQSLY